MNNLENAKELIKVYKINKKENIDNTLLKIALIQIKEELKKEIGCGEEFDIGEDNPAYCSKECFEYYKWLCFDCKNKKKLAKKNRKKCY